MNKVILMGRLTKNPEIKYAGKDNDMAVTRYTLAVNRRFEKIVPKSARNLSEMVAKLDDGNKKMDVFINIPGQTEPKPKEKEKVRVQDFVIHADEYCSVQEHVIINFINFIFQMSITNMYIQNPPKNIREQIYRTFRIADI